MSGKLLLFGFDTLPAILAVDAAVRPFGAEADCLKAVLTPYNRRWNAVTLYAELQRERISLRRK